MRLEKTTRNERDKKILIFELTGVVMRI